MRVESGYYLLFFAAAAFLFFQISFILSDWAFLAAAVCCGLIAAAFFGAGDFVAAAFGFAADEVEIVRIHTPFTVHAEVTSLRARRSGERIHHRVLDEYGSRFTFRHKTSKLPLRMAEVIELMNSTESGNQVGQGLVAGFWEDWTRSRIDEDFLLKGVVITSDYYPRLAEWYAVLREWVEAKRRKVHSDSAAPAERGVVDDDSTGKSG